MRTIRTKVYKFSELSEPAKQKAICSEIDFCMNFADNILVNEVSAKMEKMQTPWFTKESLYHDHKQYFIDLIEANDYEFFEDGKLIPARFHGKNEPDEISIDTAVRISKES